MDNLPKVPKEKLEKLMGVIERIFGQVGSIKEGGPFYLGIILNFKDCISAHITTSKLTVGPSRKSWTCQKEVVSVI